MFTIIGGDQKQYGPVSAEEVRQWIRDGRADGRTLARTETDSEWKPLSAFPEFAAILAERSIPPTLNPSAVQTGTPTIEEILARDYELDIFDCISRGWALFKKNSGPMVAITLLVVLANGAVNYAVGLISGDAFQALLFRHEFTAQNIGLVLVSEILGMPIQAIFIGGLYKYYIKLVRGEAAEIGDAFYGFSHALAPLALLGLVSGLLIFVGIVLCIIPGIYLAIAWSFSIPLIVDKELGFWEAMTVSLKVVNKHWFMVLGLILVVGLVSVSGVVACCVGFFVTITIGYAALMYAYEEIFGRPGR